MIVRLDFGGEARRARTMRVGPAPGAGVQIAAQLGARLPFRDSSVDELFLDHAAAHTGDLLGLLEELWRVSKPGTLIHARFPHASCAWSSTRDPRQPRRLTIETFNYFDPRHRDPSCRSCAAFQIEMARLYLKGPRLDSRGRLLPRGVPARVLEGLVNQSRGMQYRWERWFAPLVGGFEEFYVVLSAVKDSPFR